MQARQSQQSFDHHYNQQQYSQQQLTQGYQGYQNAHHGYSNTNTYAGSYSQATSQQTEETSYQPKSFLSQNSSPKSNFNQQQNSLKQQFQQQAGYSSPSASTLSTKRDFLSPSTRLQQQSHSSSLVNQQNGISSMPQQQQQHQSAQAFQPLTNNFFNNLQEPEQQHSQSQKQFKGGYTLAHQQQTMSSPSAQQSQFQQISDLGNYGTGAYSKKNSQQFQQLYQQQQQQQQQRQPSQLSSQQQQQSSQFSNKLYSPDENRHSSVDQMRNKENLQNTLQKMPQNSQLNNKISVAQDPAATTNSHVSSQSTQNLQSYQKINSSTSTKVIRPSPRDGNTQPSIPSSTDRQQLRASTSSGQIDSRVQRNSFTSNQLSQNSKNPATNDQISAYPQSRGANQTLAQENPQQNYNTIPYKGHMYQSNIVPSSPQMVLSGIHQNMKRSDVIDGKQSSNSYSNSLKQNNAPPKEAAYKLFQNEQRGKSAIADASRANRPQSNHRNELSEGNISIETQKKDQAEQKILATATQGVKPKRNEGDRKSISNKPYSPIDSNTYQARSSSQSQFIQPKTAPERRDPKTKQQAQSTVFSSEKQTGVEQPKTTEPRVYSEEYQEYKKLQEKLNYLESKIMSIKTNIDTTYQKEKEEQQKDVLGYAKQPKESYQLTFQQHQLHQRESSAAQKQSQQGSQSGLKSSQTESNPQAQQPASKESFSYFSSQKKAANTKDNSHLQDSANSKSTKISRDQEGGYQGSKGNSFSVEQTQPSTNGSKNLSKNPSSSSSSNLLKNTPSSAATSSAGGQLPISPSTSQETLSVSKSNPLSSFVTQVSKGSGIPLSPKTATNTTKRAKLEEKVSSSVHYDPNSNANSLSTTIPKTYLSKLQASQQKTSESKNNINSSYTKKREDSDSFDGSNNLPSSTKNQGKNSLVLSNTKTTTSAQSLKNSNVFAGLSQVSSPQGKKTPPPPPFIYYVSQIVKSYLEPQNQSIFAGLAREHLIQTMQAINFARMLKPASQKVIDEKKIFMPTRRDGKKTLVFDLDETLIHCNENSNIPSDVVLPIKFPTGEIIEAGINVRPYCLEILQELSKLYEIVIFTASHSCYANVVLDYLDPKGQYISARLFRENCVTTDEGVYIKDLRVIQNRSLSDLVLVDNAAYSFGFQIDNGIPIIPFYDNKNDSELKHLTHFMKSIHNVRDLRDIMRKFLKVGSYSEFADPLHLISSLFEELIQ